MEKTVSTNKKQAVTTKCLGTNSVFGERLPLPSLGISIHESRVDAVFRFS